MGLEDVEDWYGGSYDVTPAGPTPPAAKVEGAQAFSVAEWAPLVALVPRGKTPGDALVLGRFLPVHRGHARLLAAAVGHVAGRVHVGVSARSGDLLTPAMRARTLFALLPPAAQGSVAHAQDLGRQGEPDGDDFWQPWLAWLGQQPSLKRCRVLVSGTPSARRFAELAGLEFHLVDRSEVPVSGTAIRADPWKHWDDIAPLLRQHYTRAVALVGPEGAGKSTLGEALRVHYGTRLATEYTPRYLATFGLLRPRREDFAELERGVLDGWDAARQGARKLFFLDTELLQLWLWERRLFGDVKERRLVAPALTLLLDDAPWLGSPERDEPEARRAFVAELRRELEQRGWPYVFISGPREARLEQAIRAVDRLRYAGWSG